jgi:V8-like Glu-specific endopeptidase
MGLFTSSFLTPIAICKLFVTFNGAVKEATGWCFVGNQFIITAGHCLYDDISGRAVVVEAHISYHGPSSDLRKTHEVRFGTSVAVHHGWYDSFLRENDIALIRLGNPFEDVIPLKWKNCPVNGINTTIHVVGYPGDLPPGMEGQFMYESTGRTNWDLESNGMLIHQVDTFKGSIFVFPALIMLR